ncbi:MAG: DcaP family trimeric outer membrane transporter, partial [Blastocatellia bacterium]
TQDARSAQPGNGAANAAAKSDQTRSATDNEKAPPEVQQLKERLQQLEQAVQELKSQITGMEQAQKTAAAASTATAPAAVHQETATASAETQAEKPVERSEESEKKADNTITVYGFAMLDAGYEFGQSDPNWFDVLRPSKLPAFTGQFAPDGKVFYGVRQSRLGVKTSLDTKYGELKTIFEFELFGVGVDAGQTTFRLRHAYGELGHFGAGQTWTAFMDPDIFPNELEYWGPNGMVWFRNVQFRFMPLKGNNAITIALERPGASGDQGVFADRVELQGIKPKFDLPDLTGNVRLTRDWGHLQISGIVKRIKWVDTTNPPKIDLGGSVVGWGVNVSSNIKLSKNDIARLEVVYGPGIENYMNDAPVDVGIRIPRVIDPFRPLKGEALPV